MADDTDDVLVLGPEIEIEEPDEQTDGGAGGDGDEELVIGFGGKEAAPASGDDSSVIRDLRKANREMAKKLAIVDRANQPQMIEVGEKPTMALCEYDEDRFEAELDQWKGRKARADQQATELETRKQAQARENQERVEAYQANKASLRVTDFDDAEETVAAALSDGLMNMLLRTISGKPAALIYALSKSPEKLAELAQLDSSGKLVEAAQMVGALGASLKMETRKAQTPERKISGNAGFAPSDDKQLARLEKEAERTGDRTALIAHRRKLRA